MESISMEILSIESISMESLVEGQKQEEKVPHVNLFID